MVPAAGVAVGALVGAGTSVGAGGLVGVAGGRAVGSGAAVWRGVAVGLGAAALRGAAVGFGATVLRGTAVGLAVGGGGATTGDGSDVMSPDWISTNEVATHPCSPVAATTASQPFTRPSAVKAVALRSLVTIG